MESEEKGWVGHWSIPEQKCKEGEGWSPDPWTFRGPGWKHTPCTCQPSTWVPHLVFGVGLGCLPFGLSDPKCTL